jgi:hypothetical protein
MDLRLAMEDGRGEEVSCRLREGANTAKLAPAVIVPARKKWRLENMEPPFDRQPKAVEGDSPL